MRTDRFIPLIRFLRAWITRVLAPSIRISRKPAALYVSVTDAEAVEGLGILSRLEGIIPALEPSHAVAWVVKEKSRWKADDAVLICISGRGDKDLAQITEMGLLPA